MGEQRASLLEQRQEHAGTFAEGFACTPGGVEKPRQVLAPHHRDRRGPSGRSAARRLVRAGQTAPGDLAGEAELIEQGPVVAGDTRRQHIAFPGSGRRLESLQLPDDLREALRSVQLRPRLRVLPAEEEPEEILRSDRLDLAPEPAQSETMDARQQRPLAPLGFHRTCPVPAAQHEAVVLQHREFRLDVRHPELLRQLGSGDRAGQSYPAADRV